MITARTAGYVRIIFLSLLKGHTYSPFINCENHSLLQPKIMEARREEERSMFESSHLLGAYLASTPLLTLSWRLCQRANSSPPSSFVAEEADGVVYVAFSGARGGGPESGFFCTVPIGSGAGAGRELFRPLARGEEPVLVHAQTLQLFLEIYNKPEFKMLITETRNKSVILTGHSLGGSLASLAALHFLCSSNSDSTSSPASLLCITFGSPLLGNVALSRAVLRETWAGNFCHVISQHDITPRILFCPPNSVAPHLIAHLLHAQPASPLPKDIELCQFVSGHVRDAAANEQNCLFWPFGCYALCSSNGVVCIDNQLLVVQMLHWTFVTGYHEKDHLLYGELVARFSQNSLTRKRIDDVGYITSSNYRACVSLALEASGIGNQEMTAMEASECWQISKRIGQSPYDNITNLSIKLAKVTPYRAQIEWYKSLCDDDAGYYDSFKHRRASKRDDKVNMNRIRLARFWEDVVDMLQNNQLPHDFLKRRKWVNAANFYKLLVEPLDIAEYYKNRKSGAHYVAHGRPRRYQVFDRWWKETYKGNAGGCQKRSRFAGQTQDSCFWARVEEASEWLEVAKKEKEVGKLARIWEDLCKFECETRRLIEMKEVSKDVVAPRSSYNLWMREWMDLKMSFGQQIPLHDIAMNRNTLALN